MPSTTEKTVVRDTHVHEEKRVGDASSSISSESDLGAEHKKIGVIGTIKDGVKSAVNAITGIGGHTHESACSKKTCSTFEKETSVSTEVAEHERAAHLLREQAEKTLKKNDAEFEAAERAQNQAHLVAEHANLKTAEALAHQEHGQKLMAEAGAQMIEAGAKLQREAGAVSHTVPYNKHEEGAVRQTTIVSSAGQQAAASAHESVVIREVEHTEAH